MPRVTETNLKTPGPPTIVGKQYDEKQFERGEGTDHQVISRLGIPVEDEENGTNRDDQEYRHMHADPQDGQIHRQDHEPFGAGLIPSFVVE